MSLLSNHLLSRNTKQRLLADAEQHVLKQLTKDGDMPAPLRSLINSIFRVFWTDLVAELERNRVDEQATDRERERRAVSSGSLGTDSELLGLGAPESARGVLRVLVVEARGIPPVHGMGTNPYVRGVLGQQIKRTRTAWSTLRPAWNHVMDFSVVHLSETLELEVMSQAPLFGGDTRLGVVSVSLKDLIGGGLAYRCEPLQATASGEVVLILEYKAFDSRGGGRQWCCGRLRERPRRLAAQVRAYFLYHYWPCDKSIFRQYLHEPVDIAMLLVSLSPYGFVRASYYSFLLLCLCAEWPPDEHQIVGFILAIKGTAIFTYGIGPLVQGLLAYYSCARTNSCTKGGGPGAQLSAQDLAVDFYLEVLVWFVFFALLPRTISFRTRTLGVAEGSKELDVDGDAKRGGRMKALAKYNFGCFACVMTLFLVLCLRDLMGVTAAGLSVDEVWIWRVPENLFWCRVLFGFALSPFLFLLIPRINKLLTHSTPTGFTSLGTLQRYSPNLRAPAAPSDSLVLGSWGGAKPGNDSPGGGETVRDGIVGPTSAAQGQSDLPCTECESKVAVVVADPVEDLCRAIKWFPGGSLLLRTASLGVRATSATVGVAGSIVSFEIRAASTAVSLGLRCADAGACTAARVVRFVPGSGLALWGLQTAGASASAVGATALTCSALVARQLPGGPMVLDIMDQVGVALRSMAAAAESPGVDELVAGLPSLPLLQAGSEKAEALKLEAASRLAEILTSAERFAERETVEHALELIHPELGKVALALRARGKGCRNQVMRSVVACQTMCRSLWAWSFSVAIRLPAAGESFVRASKREFGDLQAQRAGREPGILPVLQAYSRLLVSAACEALLEFPAAPSLGADQSFETERPSSVNGASPSERASSPRPLSPVRSSTLRSRRGRSCERSPLAFQRQRETSKASESS